MKNKLVELRKSRGLTQKELADLLRSNQATISRIENDKCEISPFLLSDIAKCFNVSVTYINGETGNKIEKSKIAVDGINEYEEIISCYKILNDEHKSSLKILLDYFYQIEQRDIDK